MFRKNKEKKVEKETKVEESKEEVKEEKPVEAKKEKKEKPAKEKNLVKSPLKNYKFWFKIFGGVLLVAFSIVMIFNQDIREKLCVGVFGGFVFVYALYRIIPLTKTLKEKWSKILCVTEVVIDLIVGGMLIAGGFNFSDGTSDYFNFINKYFRYFLGGVVYLRGLVYTMCAILAGEKSGWREYIINIACFTLGVVMMCLDKFNVTPLAWIMVALAIGSGGFILGEGGYDYYKYRQNFKEERDGTELEDGVEKGQAPEQSDEIKDTNSKEKTPEEIPAEIISDTPEEVPSDPVN